MKRKGKQKGGWFVKKLKKKQMKMEYEFKCFDNEVTTQKE
jgi:hypothetical protein